MLSRIISLLVAGAYLGVAFFAPGRDPGHFAILVVAVLAILVAIWFPEPFGNFRISAYTYIRPAPAVFIAVVGWLVLLAGLGVQIWLFAKRAG